MKGLAGKIHHVGYLVNDIEKSIEPFEMLGFTAKNAPVFDEIRKAWICFLDGNGTVVELIEPREDSEIFPLLKKYTNMPYHLCYIVRDLEASIVQLKHHGFLLFKPIEAAPAISASAKVAFLIHRRIGMVELLQEE